MLSNVLNTIPTNHPSSLIANMFVQQEEYYHPRKEFVESLESRLPSMLLEMQDASVHDYDALKEIHGKRLLSLIQKTIESREILCLYEDRIAIENVVPPGIIFVENKGQPSTRIKTSIPTGASDLKSIGKSTFKRVASCSSWASRSCLWEKYNVPENEDTVSRKL